MVELALHQPVHDVEQRGVDAEPREADGGLEPEQAAADDDGPGVLAPRALRIAATSARSRKVMTPGRSMPGFGSRIGTEPTASTSLSKGRTWVSPTTTSAVLAVDLR